MKRKQKCMVSAVFMVSLLTMFLTWFGGFRGIQEMKGTIVLFHPFTIVCILLAVIGIWFHAGKYNKLLSYAGLCGICCVELYYFFTWYLETVDMKFSLAKCFRNAFPEFYLGFGLSVLTFILCMFFFTRNRYARKEQ